MKRALITAAVGGLLAFVVPQAAGASARPVAPYDHSADHQAEEGQGQPEGADESEQAPPQQRNGDKEQEHSDGGEILF